MIIAVIQQLINELEFLFRCVRHDLWCSLCELNWDNRHKQMKRITTEESERYLSELKMF